MSSYSRYLQQKQNAAIKKYSDYEAYIARKNFDHFCCCLEGGTGPVGPSGAQGLFGGTSVKYSNPSTEGWNIATTPPTGPSQGIRGNNSDATQITKIYASRNDGDNNDVIDVLKILTTVNNYEKGIIKITKIDDSSRFIIMKVITVVDQTDYIEYEGSIVMATSNTPFINGEAVILTITANGENELRNELTNENAEFFPFMVRNDATVIGSTGATGYTQSGVTINPFDSGLSFTSQINNANKYRTRIVPGAITAQERAVLNIFTDSSLTATGPTAATINIGFANSKPFDILTHGSLQASSLLNYYSTVEGSTGALLNLAYQDGILLSTKQQEFTTTATPPDNQQIRLYSNFGNIYLKSTGKGVTGNAVAQGGLFLDSRTVDTTTELSKRENLRQPLYLQAAIDDGPSSQISVDRISGLQMAARTYDTNGTTGGSIQIISQTVNTSRATSGTSSRASDIKRLIQEQNTIIHDAEAGDANALAQAQAEKLRLETIRATYNTSDPEYAELTAKIDYQQTIITRESRVEDTATLNAAIAQLTKLENDLRNLPTGAFLAGAEVEPTTEIMGRLAMDNMGNVTLFSGGYTGASGANRLDGTLTIHAAGTSGSMELFNEGVAGLNIKSICNGTRGIRIENSATGLGVSDQKSQLFMTNNVDYGFEVKTKAVTTQGFGMNFQADKGNISIQTTGETGVNGGSSLLQAPHIRLSTTSSASSGGSHMFYMAPNKCKFYAPVGFEVEAGGPTGGIILDADGSQGINIRNTGVDGLNLTNSGADGMNLICNSGHLALSTANSGNEVRIGTAGIGAQVQLTTNDGSIQLLPGGAGSRINLHSSNNAAGGISLISTGLGSIFDLRSDDTIDIKADKRVNIGSNGGVKGVMHVMDGTTGTLKLDGDNKKIQLLNGTTGASGPQIILDGSNNNLFVKDGWNNVFDSIPCGFTGPSGPHPIMNIDGLYSSLATGGSPQPGDLYGYLPAGKIELGGYTWSNYTAFNPDTGLEIPAMRKWQQTKRLTIDLTAGSQFSASVFATGPSGPLYGPGVANAGDLVTIKGSVNILPNDNGTTLNGMPWNCSLYLGKWAFGDFGTLNTLRAQSSSTNPSLPGAETLKPGSGNVYCCAVKQNIVHVEQNFNNLNGLSAGFQGLNARCMYYNGGDIRYCIVDSTNGNNGTCKVTLPQINNNMLGMSLTVCRMFIDATLAGPGPIPDPTYTNAVVIEGSGMDLINAPNSICVEDNGNIRVAIDPYNILPPDATWKTPTLYNSNNIGSVTFVASQNGQFNNNIDGPDYTSNTMANKYIWVVISTGSPGK